MIRPFGDSALLVELDGDATEAARRIAAVVGSLEHGGGLPGVRTLLPGLRSLVVGLEPGADPDTARRGVEEALAAANQKDGAPRLRTIAVHYDGPDLDAVAAAAGVSRAAVVEAHVSIELTVLFCGFAPGFAYIGELPTELDVPRLETPRTSTPAGSVAIAGRLTGVYPTRSPGGWRVIGRTSVRLFDPHRTPPAYLAPGDRVRFRPVSAAELDAAAPWPADW